MLMLPCAPLLSGEPPQPAAGHSCSYQNFIVKQKLIYCSVTFASHVMALIVFRSNADDTGRQGAAGQDALWPRVVSRYPAASGQRGARPLAFIARNIHCTASVFGIAFLRRGYIVDRGTGLKTPAG